MQLAEHASINVFRMYHSLKKTLTEINPDILHGHCPGSLFIIPLMPHKYKKVFTQHNFPGKYIRLIYGFKKGIVVEFITKIMINYYDKVTCCSESVLESFNRPKDKRFIAIPNGIIVPKWNRDLKEKSRLRKEFGLQENQRYFIYVGRFALGKNISLLAKAFDSFANNNVKIIMLGSGPLHASIKAMNSANIILPGFSNRVIDYLKAADYYISASDSEGMPVSLLENMSVGNPVLLSNIPAHREFLKNFTGAEVGCLMNQRDIEDIKRGINKIFKYDADNVAVKMHEIFLRKYTSKAMSESYQNVYENLMKSKNG